MEQNAHALKIWGGQTSEKMRKNNYYYVLVLEQMRNLLDIGSCLLWRLRVNPAHVCTQNNLDLPDRQQHRSIVLKATMKWKEFAVGLMPSTVAPPC
jgi:hypothetical protein